jgi:hypothetical protein
LQEIVSELEDAVNLFTPTPVSPRIRMLETYKLSSSIDKTVFAPTLCEKDLPFLW